MIYLDHASHSPADPAVLAEFCRLAQDQAGMGNPMSAHSMGRAAAEEYEKAAEVVANFFGSEPGVAFTSGASEANTLAIKGLAKANHHRGKHIIGTCLDHPSVSGPLAALREQGYEIELADINPDGTLDLDQLSDLLRQDTILLCLPWVDSELGAIQDIAAIAKLLEKYPDCHFHVDAAQAVGKVPVAFLGLDTLSFSAHKFNGLCGSGGLLVRKGAMQEALLGGLLKWRSGTPALALAASTAKALQLLEAMPSDYSKKAKALRQGVLQALQAYPKVRINSPPKGSPYILNISVKGIKGSEFQAALDRRGVCVSVKSACSAQGTPSRPVMAVSNDRKNAMCSWRLSFSTRTEMQEVDAFLEAFDHCCKELS